MKRILWVLPLILLVGLPAAAQSAAPLDWIPADFTGFVRVETSNLQSTLNDLNLGLFVASVLQPARVQFTEAQDYDGFFPLETFDVEGASFTQTVLPWLEDEVIIAYRSLGTQLNADAENTVMILPTADAFQAASYLNQVIQGQDFPEQETYRQIVIYRGDKTAFAFTPGAVLVGSDDLLHAMIDTLIGDGQALTADPVYQQVQAALPADSPLFAYVSGDNAARALGVLMSGSDAADPVLAAISESLAGLDEDNTPGRLLLGGALDGVGVSVEYDSILASNVRARVVLHTVDAPDAPDTAFDASLLDLIPRSAMIVHSGTDAQGVATGALYSLPFLNFAGSALAAFPISPSAAASVLPVPTAENVDAAVTGFLDTVQPVVDVRADLLAKLDGSYSVALLPRPNNLLPVLNTPFDFLLVVQTGSATDARTVQVSIGTLLETFAAPLEDEQLDEQAFRTLRVPDTGEPLVRIGAVDNLVVIGTGSAAELALDARRGDNRLIAQERWQNLSQDDQIPYVYVDVNAFYNTFLPTIGGPAVRPVSQLGIHSRYLGENLFELDVLVALSQ